jgi:hypothetical protein
MPYHAVIFNLRGMGMVQVREEKEMKGAGEMKRIWVGKLAAEQM